MKLTGALSLARPMILKLGSKPRLCENALLLWKPAFPVQTLILLVWKYPLLPNYKVQWGCKALDQVKQQKGTWILENQNNPHYKLTREHWAPEHRPWTEQNDTIHMKTPEIILAYNRHSSILFLFVFSLFFTSLHFCQTLPEKIINLKGRKKEMCRMTDNFICFVSSKYPLQLRLELRTQFWFPLSGEGVQLPEPSPAEFKAALRG